MRKLLLGILILIAAYLVSNHAVSATTKYWICHRQPQKQDLSLYLPWSGAYNGHIKIHRNDSWGKCPVVQPSPSPTVTPSPSPTITPSPHPTSTPRPTKPPIPSPTITPSPSPKPTPKPDPTPTPTPEPEKPSGCTHDCNPPAPVCSAVNTTKEPVNFHVYRNGGTAILKWYPSEGNKVNAYWKLNGQNDWQHSTSFDNTGHLEINDLGNLDWTFGLQQVNDCGGGVITAGNVVEVIDGDTSSWVLFQ